MTSHEKQAISAWAMKHLGLASVTDAASIRQAFLARVERDNFMPAPATAYAWQAVSGGIDTTDADQGLQQARLEIEVERRQEVDAFAGRFFELSPAERRKQWRNICARCRGIGPLENQLGDLEAGLDIVPADSVGEEGPHAQLTNMLCELFVLRPPDRARRRHELFEEMAEEMGFWETTAIELRGQFPELEALEPGFLGLFADRRERDARVQKTIKQIADSNKSSGSGFGKLGILVALVIFGLGRAAMFSGSGGGVPVRQPEPVRQFDFEGQNKPVFKFEVKGLDPAGNKILEELRTKQEKNWINKLPGADVKNNAPFPPIPNVPPPQPNKK